MRCGLPATAAIDAGVIEVYPRAAETIRAAGQKFMGRDLTQRALQNEPDEVPNIDEPLAHIARFTGRKVRGWLGPGQSRTDRTTDLLKESAASRIAATG